MMWELEPLVWKPWEVTSKRGYCLTGQSFVWERETLVQTIRRFTFFLMVNDSLWKVLPGFGCMMCRRFVHSH